MSCLILFFVLTNLGGKFIMLVTEMSFIALQLMLLMIFISDPD